MSIFNKLTQIPQVLLKRMRQPLVKISVGLGTAPLEHCS